MSYQLFDNLKRSSVIIQPDNTGDKNWESMFQMAIYLAKNDGSSFHLLDLNQIIQQFLNWKILLPRIQPFFAHSFQRDPKIAYILGSLGAGFSCASEREVNDCLLNVPRLQNLEKVRKEIIISNPFKLGSDMKNCQKSGVTRTTFMCKSELDRIKLHWPDAELLMAVVVNPDLYSHGLTISKLAAHPDQVDELLSYAKELDLNLVGLLCYHGTNFKTVSNWKTVPKIASEIIAKMTNIGFDIKILNLGDGFDFVDQENEEHEWLTFQEDLSSLNNELSEYFPLGKGIQLIAQPGKYFAQKAELFAIKVMGKRTRWDTSKRDNSNEIVREKLGILIIESSQYISFNFHPGRGRNYPNFLLTANGDLRNLALSSDETDVSTTIYGFTCDSLDIICENFPMTSSIEVGDYLIWVNRGTYGSCLMSQFNGMRPPKHFHFINKEMLTKFMELCNITQKEDLLFSFNEL